jgi:hypothetical protein
MKIKCENCVFISIDCGLTEYVPPEEWNRRIQSPKSIFLNKKSTTIDNVQKQNNVFFSIFMFDVVQRIKY